MLPTHLRDLALLAARGKHRSPDVARFLLDPAPALASLSRSLADKTYRPGTGRAFSVLDPKPRVIFALPFRDALAEIEAPCAGLRLRLHPKKTRLHRTTDAVAFLGFVLQRVDDSVRVRLKSENVERFRGRMRLARALYEVGAMGPEEIASQVRAWLAHAAHGHTRVLCERERLVFGIEEKR